VHNTCQKHLGDLLKSLGNKSTDFLNDFANSPIVLDKFINGQLSVKAWEKILSATDDGIKALRTNPTQLQKFTDIIASNNLGLDEAKLLEILNAAAAKGLKWDFPENILTAVKRASDANIPGLKVTHKKFPESAGSGGSYLVPAKNYQKAASGDANLSFDIGGRSFDDIGTDGKLIDRKFGYGNSIFDKIEDEFGEVLLEVTNVTRIKAVLRQAKGQLNAANGKPIRWEISNQTGADGISGVFNGTIGNFINDIEFAGVPFNTIEVVFKP
jgi:hypothetical protein